MSDASLAARLAARPADEQQRLLAGLSRQSLHALLYDWHFWARPKQLAPAGDDWRVWLIMAGRGFGKTRAGAEWVRALAEANGRLRVALVAASYAEAREVMIEGLSGLRSIAPPHRRPHYEVSRRRLLWPNGAQALLYSAEDGDGLRGGQHHIAWCDELAKWPDADSAWMNLQLALRLGQRPRVCITTTPRPMHLLKKLLQDPAAAVTRGATRENKANLSAAFLDAVEQAYGGTRLGRQELEGDYIEDQEGALWSRALIEQCRVTDQPPLRRVVVAIDPPVTSGEHADACGIVAVGLGGDGIAYVLADASLTRASPERWARAAVELARQLNADRLVAEANNGGDLVASVLLTENASLPLKLVRAARGKVARAEPVAALYERQRVRHVGSFPQLEDELCGLMNGGDYAGPGRSPDRADALVWAVSELLLSPVITPTIKSL